MKLYVFWNGEEMETWPAADHWHNWPPNLDTARLAWTQRENWRLFGFDAQFISTSAEEPMRFRGRLASTAYPEPRWRLWKALARQLAATEATVAAWTTIDVWNRSLTPEMLAPEAERFAEAPQQICSFMDAHISLAAGMITAEGCRRLENLLYQYDASELAEVRCELPSDESILRERGAALVHHLPIMGMSHNAESYESRPLLHFPRSELLTFKAQYNRDVIR